MKPRIEIDKSTNVAYFDVCDPTEERSDTTVRVVSVSDLLGIQSEVLARVDGHTGAFLGLIIEDYSAFAREIRWKYLTWHVEKLMDLLVCKVKDFIASGDSKDQHMLASSF
jgi:hypothetical protein